MCVARTHVRLLACRPLSLHQVRLEGHEPERTSRRPDSSRCPDPALTSASSNQRAEQSGHLERARKVAPPPPQLAAFIPH